MSKRFMDTGLYRKTWFRHLSPAEKAAWHYILSDCDPVGVWDPDFEMADIYIGAKVDWEALRTNCNGNIDVLPNGKWLVVDFVAFQYGKLKASVPPHRKYMLMLEKHGLILPFCDPSERVQEEEEEKEEEEAEVKEEDPRNVGKAKLQAIGFNWEAGLWRGITDDELRRWAEAYPLVDVEQELAKQAQWLLADPRRKKTNYRRFITNWLAKAQDRARTPVAVKR